MNISFFKPLAKRSKLSLVLLLLISYAGHTAASTFFVTTMADDLISPPAGSLRAGINAVNAGLADTINFTIPPLGPGYDSVNQTWTIQLAGELPIITNTVTIDGYAGSPGGAHANSAAQGTNAKLSIIINGQNYTIGDGLSSGNGLHFAASPDGLSIPNNSVVKGLIINQWLASAILIDGSFAPISNISILGNFLGTDATGMTVMANRCSIGLSGVINFSINNTVIGTGSLADRNLISGNFGAFVTDDYFIGGACITSAFNSGTSIKNNLIGTDASGMQALDTSLIGIQMTGDTNSTIGGTPEEGNVIVGQSVNGITLRSCQNIMMQNNYIGVDVTGTIALGNKNAGIQIWGTSQGNTVIDNLISGNGAGIHIGQGHAPGTILNTVQHNLIGTDKSGSKALPNKRFGIEVRDSQNSFDTNTVSANLQGGLVIYAQAQGNSVTNNHVGTDSSGLEPLPNQANGVQIGLNGGFGGALNNTVGA